MRILKNFITKSFYLDLRSLALLRICMGVLLIGDLIDRSTDLIAVYTDAGIFPRDYLLIQQKDIWFSIYMIADSSLAVSILFIINGIFALMLIIGYRTTLASITCWIMVVSLQNRNPLFNSGADQVVRLILFWGMFLPWHARFSIDALRCKKNLLPNRFISAATIAYVLQIIFIYSFSALLKNSPEWRYEGTAIYYALSLDEFRSSLGNILYHASFLLPYLTHTAFYLEALGFLLLFIPYKRDFFRMLAIIAFINFHIGIGLTMGLGLFPWISSIMWFAFLPTSFWDILFKKSRHAIGSTCLLWKRLTITKTSIFNAKFSYTSRTLSVIVLMFIIYVFIWNLSTLPGNKVLLPKITQYPGKFLRINQKWNMFAPQPSRISPRFVILGKLEDGSYYDLYNNRQTIEFIDVKNTREIYYSSRWTKYFSHLFYEPEFYIQYYEKFLCREWNSKHSGTQQLKSISTYLVKKQTLLNYIYIIHSKELLSITNCSNVL